MTKNYSTRQVAAKVGIGFRTLNRWLALGTIRPSTAIEMPDGKTLWLWSNADVCRCREIAKTRLRRNPKNSNSALRREISETEKLNGTTNHCDNSQGLE
jgi:hypothetical protein